EKSYSSLMGLIVSFPDTAVVRRLWPVEPRTAGSGPRATYRPRRSHVRGRQRPLILEDRRGVGEVQPVLPKIVTSLVLVPLETAEQPYDMHNRTPTQGLEAGPARCVSFAMASETKLGPMARYVEDTLIVLQAISGPDQGDP